MHPPKSQRPKVFYNLQRGTARTLYRRAGRLSIIVCQKLFRHFQFINDYDTAFIEGCANGFDQGQNNFRFAVIIHVFKAVIGNVTVNFVGPPVFRHAQAVPLEVVNFAGSEKLQLFKDAADGRDVLDDDHFFLAVFIGVESQNAQIGERPFRLFSLAGLRFLPVYIVDIVIAAAILRIAS